MVLLGAGLSAESGIPTFRGFDGYWTIGSKNYTPQEMGTYQMFTRNPYEVWKWYLYRAKICKEASPNPGHHALVAFEELLQDRFVLVSQNVDGLHFEAGNGAERLLLIHGDLRYMRCSKECSTELYPIPPDLIQHDRKEAFSKAEKSLLICPKCGAKTRPHILWFDESYDEVFYKLDTSFEKADHTDVLFVIGTSGATTLPRALFEVVQSRKGLIINIDPNENAFSRQMEFYPNGYFISSSSGKSLPLFYAEMEKMVKG